jgi:hypothetical protein
MRKVKSGCQRATGHTPINERVNLREVLPLLGWLADVYRPQRNRVPSTQKAIVNSCQNYFSFYPVAKIIIHLQAAAPGLTAIPR